MNAQVENPRISALLRWFTFMEVIVLVTAGGLLFFAPDFVGTVWGWTLTPFNTRFLGAVYLSSMTAIAIMFMVARWSPARVGLRVIFSFTLIVLIVSLVYNSRFDFQRPGTWLWFALYVALPANAAYHLWLYRAMPTTHLNPLPVVWTRVYTAAGIALIVYGVGLILAPAFFSGFWSWVLDDFHARLYSAAFIGGGIGLLTIAPAATAYELLAAGLTQVLLGGLAIIGLLWVNASINRINAADLGTWLWLLMFGGLLVLGASMMWSGWKMTPRY